MTRMMLCSRCGALAALASEPPLCSRCATAMPAVPVSRPVATPPRRRGRDDGFDPARPPRAPTPAWKLGATLAFITSGLVVVGALGVLAPATRRAATERTYPMVLLAFGVVGLAAALIALRGGQRGALANAVMQSLTAVVGALGFAGILIAAGDTPLATRIAALAIATALAIVAASSFRAARASDLR